MLNGGTEDIAFGHDHTGACLVSNDYESFNSRGFRVDSMGIKTIEFVELEKQIQQKRTSFKDILAQELGKAYAIAITRDGCPACEKQKPKLEKLAVRMAQQHGNKIIFLRVHVKRPASSDTESLRSKDVLGHYFYPTNLVIVRTRDKGAFELYRSISPRMSELERSINASVEIAATMEKK